MPKKKWYESGWVWAGIGAGLYIFLRSKKAPAVQIVRTPPPWDLSECSPVTPTIKPYIDKFKEAVNHVYGPSSTGEVCIEVENIPGASLDERTNITMQAFSEGKADIISLDLDHLKTRSLSELVQSVLALQN